ncbi:hypothetical protein [Undibacterium fentianense]|uniref:Uncharacterized protein n=1 Tax=Undibacterium fentianense TaxID=2828728 RepID=A0A941IC75_9BURK|nr:hypothetical protein [Undibacterium fentianense]MBR7799894.1 hypothetical protein [Undibacterium fentianense]
MSAFVLPKSTTVKVGTISHSLRPYLAHGIPENLVRIALPNQTNAPALNDTNGIYLGELMAYFAAATTFCHSTVEVYAKHEMILGEFVQSLQTIRGERPHMTGLEAVAQDIALPVVLEIELGEDCEVQADLHFEAADSSEKSWKHWRSVKLARAGGIPASWIKKFYFPRLLDYKDLGSIKNSRMQEQTIDTALMIGGVMQAWHKDSPADLLLAFRQQYGTINFSQSMHFDGLSVERFFNLTGLRDPATRILNQMTIWQDLDALAKKQKIELT